MYRLFRVRLEVGLLLIRSYVLGNEAYENRKGYTLRELTLPRVRYSQYRPKGRVNMSRCRWHDPE